MISFSLEFRVPRTLSLHLFSSYWLAVHESCCNGTFDRDFPATGFSSFYYCAFTLEQDKDQVVLNDIETTTTTTTDSDPLATGRRRLTRSLGSAYATVRLPLSGLLKTIHHHLPDDPERKERSGGCCYAFLSFNVVVVAIGK